MIFWDRLSWKLQRTKRLIAEGRYADLLKSIRANMPAFLSRGKREDEKKYSHLHEKYKAFIAEHVQVKLRTGGGAYTNENIIWWLWLQGADKAPDICQACLASLRRWHPEKKIITLDADNIYDYITLPDYIEEKHKQGSITHAHFSDIIRTQLLAELGGTWIDSTVFCTGRNTEYIMHLPLFVFKWDSPIFAASSWFMAAYPHDPIITLTRDLLFDYWKDNDEVLHYFLVHMFLNMSKEAYRDEWDSIPYMSNQPPFHMGDAMYDEYTDEKMKYFEGISDFHKLTYKFKKDVLPNSLCQHIIDSYKKQ